MPWRDLNKGSFQCPPLSAFDHEALLSQAKAACKHLVVTATTADSVPIDRIALNNKTGRHATFRKIKDTVDPSLEGVHAHTRVRAAIGEVADFFHLNSQTKLEDYDRVMKDWVVKLTTLYTLVDRSNSIGGNKSLHSLSVIWKVTKMATTSPRDLCLLDYHDDFTFYDNATGQVRRGWARCIHSIDLPCCPDLEERCGLKRTTVVRSGHVFIESSEPGELDYYKVHITVPRNDSFRHISEMFYRTMLKFYSSSMLKLEEHFIRKRIKPLLDLPVSRFPNKADADYCLHCFARFNWLTTRRQCRICGDVTCNKCCVKWSIRLDTHKHAIKVDVCQECSSGDSKRDALGAKSSATSSTILGPHSKRQGQRSCPILERPQPARVSPSSELETFSSRASERVEQLKDVLGSQSSSNSSGDSIENFVLLLSPGRWRESLQDKSVEALPV
ncbi:hypothetical protein AeNC1_000758 [Aphanomyces euteiches]|nr:hypothetical protein AeNC1_000758 [Aphanomyces euteiches]